MNPDELLKRLTGLRDAAVNLLGNDAPRLCRLEVHHEPVADGYGAIAPAQRAAGDGWLECAAEAAWFARGDDFARHAERASPLLAAELVVDPQRSLHLRRARAGLVLADLREHAAGQTGVPPEAVACLAQTQTRMSTRPGCWLDYTVYWTCVPAGRGAALALRPWRCRLAAVRSQA